MFIFRTLVVCHKARIGYFVFGGLNVQGCLYTFLNFQLVSEWIHLIWFHYLSVILDPLCVLPWIMLYASIDIVECNMPHVCENASMSVNPHKCDDMLFESMGVDDKLL